MFGYRRHHHLPDLPVSVEPGLDVEVVHVDPVVVLVRLGPLHVQTAVTRTRQISDQSSENIFFKWWCNDKTKNQK